MAGIVTPSAANGGADGTRASRAAQRPLRGAGSPPSSRCGTGRPCWRRLRGTAAGPAGVSPSPGRTRRKPWCTRSRGCSAGLHATAGHPSAPGGGSARCPRRKLLCPARSLQQRARAG